MNLQNFYNLPKHIPTPADLREQTKKVVDNLPEIAHHTKDIFFKLPAIKEGLGFVGKSDKTEVLSIGSFIEKNATLYPYRSAILFENVRYTFKEFNEWVNQYANHLQSAGLRKGDSVAVLMENRPELLVVVGALVKLGAIAALINTTQRGKTLTHSFTLCDPKMCVVGEELLDVFMEVKEEVKLPEGNNLYYVPDTDKIQTPEEFVNLADVTADASKKNPLSTKNIKLEDPCFYIYTSGTTGLPKASIMTHNRWVKAGGAFGMVGLNMKPEDTIYISLPFYHNNALTVAWASACFGGSTIAIRRKFSASNFWEDTRKFNATAFCYIGELCRYLMNQPPSSNDSDNPVYKIVGNGLRPDIWKEFKQRFDIPEVYEFYAASEGNIAFVNLLNLDCTVGLCPAPFAIVEYDIDADKVVRDSNGFLKKVEVGEVGLLLGEVSEKYSFDGYTDKKASEKKLMRNVFKEGDVWFDSGDLMKNMGFRHAQFIDRIGDTFRWQGENVSTTEVSEAINQFGQVSESTVYGVEIPNTEGRAGMVSLVANTDVKNFNLDSFLNTIKQNLAPYAVPRFIRIREDLEITGTFKHRKVELKKEGYDPSKIKDPLFVLLPGSGKYEPMTQKIFDGIQRGDYRF